MSCNIKNIVETNDFSCRDTYCFGEGDDIKLLDKKDYHVATYPDELFTQGSVKPKNDSIPATDGLSISYYHEPFNNIIISDGGYVREIFMDCEILWKVTYLFCDDYQWEKVDVDLNPDSSQAVELDCSKITQITGITIDL